MTNLQSLASLGEIIGAIAVVVSLVYLAVQVRQSTRAQRLENASRILDRTAAMQAALSRDPAMSTLFAKGISDPSKLTPQERIQFTWAMYEFFGALEFMFLAAKEDSIPDEIWQRWSSAAAWWLTFPGVQAWWDVRPIPFADSFSSYVESLLDDNPTDADITRRYQDFLAHGKRQN
ncbi:MAG TPA: hypothetical protein VK854_12710 [Woeseiaceae bacterium]|nr:hypothetical protein [Woeseiaceae bacterium]